MVAVAVCSSVAGIVKSIDSVSITLSNQRSIRITREWMSETARSELYKLKVGDHVVIDVVEDRKCLFAVEIHPQAPAGRVRRRRTRTRA